MTGIFPDQSQGLVLFGWHHPLSLRLRGFHPLWRPIPGDFGSASRMDPANTSQLSCDSWFALPSSPFPRRYSGNAYLVSFPAPTEMFHFGAFPLPKGSATHYWVAGSPIREPLDRRLHTPPQGLSRLAAPFFGSGSPAIHLLASLVLMHGSYFFIRS